MFFGFLIGRISRVRDCYGLAENSEIQAAAMNLADAMVLAISEHGRPVQVGGTVREKVRP
jgi:hypothetical protein